MNERLIKDINELLDERVWVTKKARMEAEDRMNSRNAFSQFLVSYYTFVVLGFSIWTLVSENNDISLLTVVASVGLFGISIFVNSVGYKEQALKYKESYIKMTELEYELKNLRRVIGVKNIEEVENELVILQKEYSDILNNSENHKDVDFIKIALNKNNSVKATGGQITKYYIGKTVLVLLSVILIIAPIILYFVYKGSV